MITVVTALYAEAKPYIEHYHAKKDPSETVYQEFVSKEARILVTGSGAIAAAAAIARYYTKYPLLPSDLLLNVGIAGAVSEISDVVSEPLCAVGTTCLVVKITEQATGRTFFPDLLFRNEFLKAEILTCPKPVRAAIASGRQLPLLVDMEAAAVYQAALPYLSPERMFFIKTVSDLVHVEADFRNEVGSFESRTVTSGDSVIPFERVDPYRLMQPVSEKICTWLSQVSETLQAEAQQGENCWREDRQGDDLQGTDEIGVYRQSTEKMVTGEAELLAELYRRLSFTEAMKQETERLLRYCRLSGISVTGVLLQLLSELPEEVHGKKNSMPYLKRLRELLLQEDGRCTIRTEHGEDHAGCEVRTEHDKNVVRCSVDTEYAKDTLGENTSNFYLPVFSNVYVEEQLLQDSDLMKQIFGKADFRTGKAADTIIPIRHYKDVFNRSRQNFSRQKKSPSLILARKEGTLLYPGAPVCQSFGNEHFYYTSNIMNCIYHCDYCYLQGMYPSGHLVVFVNQEDTFAELDELLKQHPVYLCVSYDTDLLALERRFGFVKRWIAYAAKQPDLTLEIRTKSGNPNLFPGLVEGNHEGCSKEVLERVIFAWTLSPESCAARYEHHAAPLSMRLRAANAAAVAGFSVRFCFDPMIFTPSWRADYGELVSRAFREFPPEKLYDASVGVFRIGSDYLKQMRKNRPDSAVVWFPYISENGVSHYGALSKEMTDFMRGELLHYLSESKLFFWE